MNSPIYRKLSEDLKRQIQKGVYAEGDLLPSENELCNLHSITRSTVRQALGELEKQGYITRKQGKGSVVNQRREKLGLLSIRGFSQAVSGSTKHPSSEVLIPPRLQPWPHEFFYPLNEMEEIAGCIYLKRLRLIEGKAIMLEDSYIPNLNLPRFESRPMVKDSLFETLVQNYGVEVINLEQDIRAVEANIEVAEALGLKEGKPIIHLYRKYFTSRKELCFYSSLYCNTDNYALSSKME